MERMGFIRDKLSIKMLILFILNRLPRPVPFDVLTELVICDDGISYFDYVEALNELVKSEHAILSDGRYSVTPKGAANSKITESSIPYSVRLKAEKATLKEAREMRRNAMIDTTSEAREDGSVTVHLGLADSLGDIMKMDLLVGSDAQAEKIKKRFRLSAELLYNEMIDLLMREHD